MAGIENKIFFGEGLKLQPSSSDSILRMQENIDDVSTINHTGDPEGVVSANPSSISHDPVSGNIYLKQTGTGNTGWINLTPGASNDYHVARFIVSAGGLSDGANYTTIAAAITAAVTATGVQTIFVQPGTYTEDLTLAANVNIVAFVGDNNTPTVTIVGKLTATFAGSCSLSGIRLTTNSDNFLAVTGSNATIVTLNNCYLNCLDNTGITYSVSNVDSRIVLINCGGDLGTTGIGLVTNTSTGQLKGYNTVFTNSGSSLTASSTSAGLFVFRWCDFPIAFTATSSGSIDSKYSNHDTSTFNLTSIAVSGTGTSTFENCALGGGTATAATVDTGSTLRLLSVGVNSSNSDAISGAGTVIFSNIDFIGTSSNINVTTQSPLVTTNDLITVVTPGAYPYTTKPQDALIKVDTASARTITPLANPKTGQKHIIKDTVGTAATFNITVTPSGKNIDGNASFVMNVNYGSITIVYNGTEWSII
jgi:pectin methylesterase-like acyl-CoA thioesterase